MRVDSRTCWAAAAISVIAVATVAAATPDGRLADAAKRRDARAVSALLKQGADVNAPHPDGATALHWAAHWNDLDTARLLLRAKARVDVANDYGVTPLSLACSDAGAGMVEALLQAGANPNLALPGGETPLMTASRANNLPAVKALLARGANVNAREATHGQTALMWALSRTHRDVAGTLIDRGADIRTRTNRGFTALMFAARQGDMESVRMLLARGADANETATDGTSVLLVAVLRAQAEVAAFLLDRGADANASGTGYTPLHWAAGTWETQTTREYIDAPPNPADFRDEWTAMIGLQGDAKIGLVKALLAHGADPNARMTTPAPRFGYSFHSYEPSGGSLRGSTPFLLAAAAGDVPMMRLLVSAGADPWRTATDHTTALMLAAGMTSIEEEHSIPESRHVDAAGLALELGVAIDAANDQGNTALHATSFLGFPKVAEFLVAKGAALNPTNKNGETPLRVAEGTIINSMFFIHDKVADVLRKLGGTSDGSGVCTGSILKQASVNAKSTVCEPAQGSAPAKPDQR